MSQEKLEAGYFFKIVLVYETPCKILRVDLSTRKGRKVERIFGNTYIHGTGRRTAGSEI